MEKTKKAKKRESQINYIFAAELIITMTHNYLHTAPIEESTMIHFDLRDQREPLVDSRVSYIDIN